MPEVYNLTKRAKSSLEAVSTNTESCWISG
jgi:hypothetical protein